MPPMRQTAVYCGMNWMPPIAVNGAHEVPAQALREAATALRETLDTWRAAHA